MEFLLLATHCMQSLCLFANGVLGSALGLLGGHS